MGCTSLFAQREHARTELSNTEVERCKRGCKHYPASTGEEVATRVWEGFTWPMGRATIPFPPCQHGLVQDTPGLSYSHPHLLGQMALMEAGQEL